MDPKHETATGGDDDDDDDDCGKVPSKFPSEALEFSFVLVCLPINVIVDVSTFNRRMLPSHPPVTNDVLLLLILEVVVDGGGCNVVKLNNGPEFIL